MQGCRLHICLSPADLVLEEVEKVDPVEDEEKRKAKPGVLHLREMAGRLGKVGVFCSCLPHCVTTTPSELQLLCSLGRGQQEGSRSLTSLSDRLWTFFLGCLLLVRSGCFGAAA